MQNFMTDRSAARLMSRTAHIFLFIGYVIVAAIVGLTFPGGVLNVEDNGAWLLAGLVFLVGLAAARNDHAATERNDGAPSPFGFATRL